MVLRKDVSAVLQGCGSLTTQLGAVTARLACLGAHTVFVVVLLWKELAAEECTLSPKLKLCSARCNLAGTPELLQPNQRGVLAHGSVMLTLQNLLFSRAAVLVTPVQVLTWPCFTQLGWESR